MWNWNVMVRGVCTLEVTKIVWNDALYHHTSLGVFGAAIKRIETELRNLHWRLQTLLWLPLVHKWNMDSLKQNIIFHSIAFSSNETFFSCLMAKTTITGRNDNGCHFQIFSAVSFTMMQRDTLTSKYLMHLDGWQLHSNLWACASDGEANLSTVISQSVDSLCDHLLLTLPYSICRHPNSSFLFLF